MENAAAEIQRRKAIVQNATTQPVFTEKRNMQINPSRVKLAHYDRQEWVVNAEITHNREDLLKPEYWAHIAQQLNPYDHIEVRSEDGTWMAELIVVQADRTWAKVVEKGFYEFITADAIPDGASNYKVEWKGPQHRFCVIRVSDSAMLHKDCRTKQEAEDWLRDHEKTVTT